MASLVTFPRQGALMWWKSLASSGDHKANHVLGTLFLSLEAMSRFIAHPLISLCQGETPENLSNWVALYPPWRSRLGTTEGLRAPLKGGSVHRRAMSSGMDKRGKGFSSSTVATLWWFLKRAGLYITPSRRLLWNTTDASSYSTIDWFLLLRPASPASGGVGNLIYEWRFW
jgi:hypothetical protein